MTPTLTDAALLEWREKAQKATPGPWSVRPIKGYTEDEIITEHPDRAPVPGDSLTWHRSYVATTGLAGGQSEFGQEFEANSAHIAACDPQTITALIDEVLALRKDLDRMRGELNTAREACTLSRRQDYFDAPLQVLVEDQITFERWRALSDAVPDHVPDRALKKWRSEQRVFGGSHD